MQIAADGLTSHLDKGVKPIYVISGDEPLLAQEAADAVRLAARKAGCDDRTVWDVNASFDWDAWFNASQNGSLFASRTLVELRFSKLKMGDDGARVLKEYAGRVANSFDVLLMVMPKVDGATQKTVWFKSLVESGVHVPVWPLTAGHLPAWIRSRMKRVGLTPSNDAVMALVDRVEGNLLACSQEIAKLHLLHGSGPIEVADVEASVADSARFDVFELADLVLTSQSAKVARVIERLREEGVEPTIVLWALAREARQMAQLSTLLKAGDSRQVWQRFAIWERRQPLVRQALRRHGLTHWQAAVRQAAGVDRVIKSAAAGNPWDELLELALSMAGQPALRSQLGGATGREISL